MARKVKCAVTGKYGTSDEFVKINGKYYSSYDVYAEYVQSAEYWKKTVEKLACEYLGYTSGQPFPTLLTKRLRDLSFYDNETIYRTVVYSEDAIRYSVKMKQFGSEHAKINYIMAILRANINTVFKEVLEERRQLKKQPSQMNADIDGMDEASNPKQKTKDISKFVED